MKKYQRVTLLFLAANQNLKTTTGTQAINVKAMIMGKTNLQEAQELINALKDLGVNQSVIARETPISRSSITKWMAGKKKPQELALSVLRAYYENKKII